MAKHFNIKLSKQKPGTQSAQTTLQFQYRYWLVLVIIAFLFCASYWILMATLNKQANFVSQINTIGKQNALSQEIAKQTLSLRYCNSQSRCLEFVRELTETIDKFIINEKKLLKNHEVLAQDGMNNSSIDSLIQNNHSYSYKQILEASRALIALKETVFQNSSREVALQNSIALNTQKILFREQVLTFKLSQVARLYDKEAQDYIKRIKVYQSLVLGLAFLILLIEAFLLFPQIVRKINLYLKDLEEAHYIAQVKNQEILETNEELHAVKEKERLDAEAIKDSHENLLNIKEELILSNQELTEKNKRLEKTDALIKANQELEDARYLDKSLNSFTDIMRWRNNQTIFSWSEKLLNELIPYIEAYQGVLYAYDPDKDTLMLSGGYALENLFDSDRMEVEIGDQFVGQAAKSRKSILLNHLNGQAKAYQTQTATQQINPAALYVLPLIYNDQLAGVLEVSSTTTFETKHLQLLEKMATNIAAHLNALQDQKRINQLFADSQMAQKQLRQSLRKIRDNEERFRKLSEVTQEGLLFLNGIHIKDVNSVVVKMMGYEDAEELLDQNYIQFIAPQYRFEIEEKQILEDGRVHETLAMKKNGDTFPIDIQAREVSYEGEDMRVLSIRDITEKKKTEQQLEEANRIASLVTELEKKNKDITSSIEYAQRIQEAILPSEKLIGKGFLQHFVMYIPKDIVSGDFYWFAEKNEHALIAAVDCTGHGVPGAFMSIIGYSNLNQIVIEQGITQPDTILNKLDKQVSEVLKQKEENSQSRDGMDVALCSLNVYEKTLSYAGAYRPLILIRDGELMEFKGNSFPIGGNFKYKKEKVFTQHEIKLQEGDTLYIYSDGYPDQFGGPENRKFTTKRFKKLLLEMQAQDLNQQKSALNQTFIEWKEDYRQMDDILIIGLRF
jgi:PAS domain S-box-containing protein